MVSKSDDDYDDHDEDEEEEDEGDFVPGGDDDDDDLDADFDDENLEDDEGDDSPFLSGLLYLDGSGKIIFESPASTDDDDQQVFCFTSEEKAPASWSIQTPTLEQSLLFAGTLHGHSLKLKIGISEYDTSGPMDSLDERFLKIQDDLQPLYMDDAESKAPATAKADDNEEEDAADSSAMDSKKPTRRKAGDDDEEEDSKPISRKPTAQSSDKHIFVLNAEQISTDKNGTSRTIRGVFRIPPGCSRILVPAALNIHASEVGLAASPSAKAASGSVAVAKKRSRDDDEDEGDDGVGYQELIDLHDDAGLSTEELRRRYYGGTATGTSGVDNKKAKHGTAEEDDDDDAYGF